MNSIIFRTIHKISDVLDPKVGEIYCESPSGNQYVYDGKNFLKFSEKDTRYSGSLPRDLIFDDSISTLDRIRLTLFTNWRLKDSKFESKISSILLTKKSIRITTRDQYLIELLDVSKYTNNLVGSIAEFKVSRSTKEISLVQVFVFKDAPTSIDIYEELMNNIGELMRRMYDNT